MNEQTSEALLNRIQDYLGNGGLVNPEMMEHNKVRDLIIDLRDYIQRQRYNTLNASSALEAIQNAMKSNL